MTDKQIKDWIDVSQCECYSVEDNSCNDTLSGSCMKEKCQTFRLLQTIKRKEQRCEELIKRMTKIFACLIKENRNKIVDTLWVDDITTLWDYIALTLGIEGAQTQIEEQILQKISKCEEENE